MKRTLINTNMEGVMNDKLEQIAEEVLNSPVKTDEVAEYYRVNIRKGRFGFVRYIRKQSKYYPRGIDEANAKHLARMGGTVHLVTTTLKQIK